MKIKGPGDYSGPPIPPESTGAEKSTVSNFPSEQSTGPTAANPTGRKESAPVADPLEQGLREIAQTEGSTGVKGEAAVGKIIDSVLQEMLGSDSLSRPETARLRDAMTPLLNQDENFMGKVNNLLSKMEKA